MLAGRLRDRITILKRTTEPTPLGDREAWEPQAIVWGRMAPMRVASRAAYMQALNSDVTHDVTFRHKLDIDPRENRIEWRGHQYQVIEPSMDKDTVGAYSHIVVKQL